MADGLNGLAAVVEELNHRVLELERRVGELQSQPKIVRATRPANDTGNEVPNWPAHETNPIPPTWRGFPPLETSAGAAPVIGKAVLGLAGAYLLRAVAESGSVPQLPVVILAILYAVSWMFWAVRLHGKNDFASLTFGISSTLILAPMLWESTLRFGVLTPTLSGVILIGFLITTLGLTWKHELYAIPWTVVLVAVFTCLGLIIATHQPVPLTTTLLAMALTCEIAACFGHHLTLRAVPAFSFDLALLLTLDLLTSADGVPPGYQTASDAILIALCLAPLLIYYSSIGVRTLWLRNKISGFEIVQGAVAAVISVLGSIRASHGWIMPWMGAVLLVLAGLCYWAALLRFADGAHTRNRRVSGTWAAISILAGSILLFPQNIKVAFLCTAALATVYAYKRTARISLGIHSTVFLAAATMASPLFDYIVNALAGTVPPFPHWSAWLVLISASVCYYTQSHGPTIVGYRRAMWVVPSTIVTFALAAFTVAAIIKHGASLWGESAPRLSVVRTLVNCALALALASLRSRWDRVELGWIAYAAVVFGTIKLLFEDLRYGNAASLVFSFFFYGLVLIFLPRLMKGRRATGPDNTRSNAAEASNVPAD